MTPQAQESKIALKRKVENYDIAKVDETLMLASDLARFIKENRLFHNIQGKEYVNVEGWQYAGARLGIIPIVEDLINLSTPEELKYQAKVQLMNLRTDQIIGSGFAICSNKEQGKKFYQEYAIASMAQTRAIGKAYRNILAWIIRAAGYEPTPAEEMDFLTSSKTDSSTSSLSDGVTEPIEVIKSTTSNNFQKNGNGFSEVKSPAFEQTPVMPINKQNISTSSISTPKNPITESAEVEEPVLENPATAKQKQQILLLLNNQVFTEDEKAKMVAQLNKIDSDKAEKFISKLKNLVAERQKQSENQKIAA